VNNGYNAEIALNHLLENKSEKESFLKPASLKV